MEGLLPLSIVLWAIVAVNSQSFEGTKTDEPNWCAKENQIMIQEIEKHWRDDKMMNDIVSSLAIIGGEYCDMEEAYRFCALKGIQECLDVVKTHDELN